MIPKKKKKLTFLELRLLGTPGIKTEAAARKFGAYYRAVETGDADGVRAHLQEGMDPNLRVALDPMLELAARKKRTGVIKALLEGGADPDVGRGGPLILAVGNRNHEAVRALIAAGANVNLRGGGALTPLADACFMGDIVLVDLLIRAGATLDRRCEINLTGTRGFTGATPLIIAVWEQHTDVVRALLKAGAKPTAKDSSGRSALAWAHASRKPGARQILSLLEQGGSDKPKAGPAIRLLPDFSAAARRQEFQQALSELGTLTQASPRPLRAADRTVVPGGFFFAVSDRKAATLLVAAHQERLLAQGCFLFWTDDPSKAKSSAVGILPSGNVFEAIAAVQTNGANFQVSNEEIIRRLRNLSSKHPFTLTGVGPDFIVGKLSSPVAEAGKLARWFSEFCPDVEDGETLAKELKQTRDFFLWWD